MSRTFFRQLFDAPAEIAIAQGRVVLAALSLVGIWFDPTEPPAFALHVQTTLIFYALYALTILTVLHWRVVHLVGGNIIHAVDIIIVTLLLFLSDGFSSPFLVFFTFVLLAASLRWDWQGIVATTATLTLLAVVIALIDSSLMRQSFDLKDSIIRIAYLVVTATLLAYASAHREHERARLAKLAQWPATTPPAQHRSGPMGETLAQAVSVLAARRALAIWDEGKGNRQLALWHHGHCEIFDFAGDGPVAFELADQTFSCTLPDLKLLNLINRRTTSANALDADFLTRFQVGEFSSAPFHGIVAQGRLFLLENIRPSDDHLLITRIVADRVGAEIDRQIFLEEAGEKAAAYERASIMRDLHDGLLQNLTAARAQLELLTSDDEREKARIETIRGLLRTEQLRLRQFIDEAGAADTEMVELESLASWTDEIANFWGCEVQLVVEPGGALISRKVINQLTLLIAEAVANAVRHGQAKRVRARLCYENDQMQVEIKDDGQGFPHRAKVQLPEPIQSDELPRSLHQRIANLQGQFQVWTSDSGTRLQFAFPA
jgi:signal transduction histidine kinase